MKVRFQQSLYSSRNPTRRYLHQRRLELIASMVTKYAHGGVSLEIGIGANLYGALLKGCSAKVIRLDLDREYIVFARSEDRSSRFVRADVLQLPFGEDKFDLVLFSEVLEHLPPAMSVAALQEIRRVVRSSGVAILSTPQKYCPIERLAPLLARPVFRAAAQVFYREPVMDSGGILDHRNLLTRPALRRQISEAGLRVIEARRCGMYIPLLAEVGGEWAAGLEARLEDKLQEGLLGNLLWTQIYVLGKGQ